MEQTLAYLREILSNYNDDYALARQIYKRLEKTNGDEISFVRGMDQEEMQFLNKILPQEIEHALDAQDFERTSELNHIYELLI